MKEKTMWATLTALAALGPAAGQAGELTLTNVRPAHGVLGPTRAEDRLLPGDSYVVSFDIEGISADASGRVRYAMGTEVSNSAGRALFRQDARDLEATASLGGRVPAFARVDVGLDQPPGDYTLRVTVTDRATGRTGALTRQLAVLPRGFGLVRLALTSDPDAQYPAPVPGAGQSLRVNVGIVGFARDRASAQPHVTFQALVREERGQPTLARPLTGTVSRDVPEKAQSLPIHFPLSLNRPGKFTLELAATDEVGKKTAKLSTPLVVRPVR
jgi:hypothetical protein